MMSTATNLLFSYLLGGLTFLPGIFLAVLCHFYFFVPKRAPPSPSPDRNAIPPDQANKDLEEKLAHRTHEPDVAAGYFAVCREYVPGGVNGKPPERVTPAGETVALESPSVYQSMYRTIFERGRSQAPSIDTAKTAKRARNVFYVVLRLNHLVLFDSADQLEIRHVISLAHHDVDIYAGGEDIPEGELWIKRNCIRLTKKPATENDLSASQPFYLFSDNCSEKEDFYHALLHNQERESSIEPRPPKAQLYQTDDMIKLIRQLHASEENGQMRWFNAILGRLFLALYQTDAVESFFRTKLTKKMSRVPKPAFIQNLRLEQIEAGDSAPIFTNPRLKEMTVDGAVTIESDVKYYGNFKLVIAAVARIELGSRLKAREVNMILAGILRKLEGHVLVKFKPPPSNRLWMSFEMMPKMDIHLEPIVSSRPITYGLILGAIEKRVREVVAETIVLPNWDDVPFTNTESQRFRGGIWSTHEDVQSSKIESNATDDELNETKASTLHPISPGSTHSNRRGSGVSTAIDVPTHAASSSSPSLPSTLPSEQDVHSKASHGSPHLLGKEKPKAMRSNSFAAAATPVVSKSPAMIDSVKQQAKDGQLDAASAMKTLSNRSPEMSPVGSPSKDLSSFQDRAGPRKRHTQSDSRVNGSPGPAEILSRPSSGVENGCDDTHDVAETNNRPATPISDRSEAQEFPLNHTPQSLPTKSSTEKSKSLNQSIGSATAAARNWSLGMLQRPQGGSASGEGRRRENSVGSQGVPIGRGQPLPPPGQPLPRPERESWSSVALNSFRKRPVAGSSPTTTAGHSLLAAERAAAGKTRQSSPSTDERSERQRQRSNTSEDVVMRVSAPEEEPASGAEEEQEEEQVRVGDEKEGNGQKDGIAHEGNMAGGGASPGSKTSSRRTKSSSFAFGTERAASSGGRNGIDLSQAVNSTVSAEYLDT